MEHLQTDYLIIGSGAVGMAFVDTMLAESEARFIMVDRHHMPGGHWNDAYPFVRLHQPSAFYGVASKALGSNRIDKAGSNQGFYELASGAETLAYFDQVMREHFLPSGRVPYYPMCDWTGGTDFKSLVSGETYTVDVSKRVVNSTFFQTSVPSTHVRKFTQDDGVACIAPNSLPRFAPDYKNFTIIGGGKTAMDTGVWLLDHGVTPDRITWVCPRASWLINRDTTQPGADFFQSSIGGFAAQLEASAVATSVDDLFERLEAADVMLRIDPGLRPDMFHYATTSKGEVAQLARITHVIRGQHVTHLGTNEIILKNEDQIAAPAASLYIDCTATAVDFKSDQSVPIFSEDMITLQAAAAPLATTSAAIIAYIEANFETTDEKNALCTPVPLADTPAGWMKSMVGNMMNRNAWSQHPGMSAWLTDCRLDPFGDVIRNAGQASPENAAIMARLSQSAVPAVINLQKLISEAAPS